MSKANKKQRHKARREAKRKEMRRRDSVSPVKRLAEAKGEIECWMSDGFEQFGQIQILIHKRTAGLSGVACFLIDRGVVGLKDVWCKMRVDRMEFTRMVEKSADHGISMELASVADARRWIAGGVRWAHDNGMRLPKDWAKVASIIGGVGDWANADVSRFKMEFAGHPDDLRQRLIAQPFEEFMLRNDIQFIFNEAAPLMDIETGEYDDDDDFDSETFIDIIPEDELRFMLQKVTARAAAMTAQTSDWLAARDEQPAPELLDAWRSVLIGLSMTDAIMPDEGSPQFEVFEEVMIGLRDRIDPDRIAEYDCALGKVLDHLETDPKLISRSLDSKLAEEQPVSEFIDVSAVETSVQQ
jgi:hypothetical protein